MPDITPNDIIHTQFRTGFRGYATHEVDDFLQQVADSLFHALEDAQRVRRELEEVRGRLEHYQHTEELLKNTLLVAERTAEEVRAHAQQEAHLLQRETQVQLQTERAAIEEARNLRLRALAELRGMLQAQLALLEAQESRILRPGERTA
jgi:cell division initiation protein